MGDMRVIEEPASATFLSEPSQCNSEEPAMPPKEMLASEVDDLFRGLVDDSLQAESSCGGWTSDGEEDMVREASLNHLPSVNLAFRGGLRQPYRFRPGVPRL